ncbi:unnamed protein product [Fusarium fujikuroi]|uniref:Alcohol dehydrogenase-like C-terminal domain-containing protein n=1 Tax=Fusarium fujikuroi TaxID=5127 RepID=A0A9Q9RSM7_FUSFU|nr:unnamed protein product [Fusarium fujikuroi]
MVRKRTDRTALGVNAKTVVQLMIDSARSLSVGDDAKFDFITKELGFDAGFNYKKESPKDALSRLAPNGIDIYFENVGGDYLKAALNNINVGGCISVCGLGLLNLIAKQVKMEGFLKWLADGSVKAKLYVTEGIDNAAEGFIGMLQGKNFGKAVLKLK